MLVVTSRITVPDDELHFTYARSGGPGGQNVNKVNSKAILRWPFRANTSVPEEVKARFATQFRTRITVDGDVVIHSDRYRDQGRNNEDCLAKLKEMLLAVAVPPKKRRPTKPSRASKERRLKSKTETSAKKKARRQAWD